MEQRNTAANNPFRNRITPLATVLAAMLVAGAHEALAAPRADLTVLPTLGGDASMAHAINEAGQVVGASTNADGGQRAFLWDAAGGMRNLGTLPPYRDSVAWDINNLGQVAGYAYGSGSISDSYALVWDTTTGTMQILDGGFDVYAQAYGINDAGVVVGHGSADVWYPDGTKRRLPGLIGPLARSRIAINEAGQVAGEGYDGSTAAGDEAFLWDPVTGMRGLGTLGGEFSGALGLNGSGQVVGWSVIDAPGPDVHAFLWDAAGGMRDLGTLGGTYSAALSINDAGQVVGASDTDAGQRRAFLWRNGVMTDLANLVGPATLFNEYTPSRAFDINEYAQIVGEGDYRYLSTIGGVSFVTETRGFLLTLHPDWQGGDGDWDDASGTHWNWAGTGTAAAKIGTMHDVVIDPGVAATVQGSADGRARSLRIGGTAGTLVALDLNNGTTTVQNGTTLAEGGILQGSGRLQGDLTVQAGGRVSVEDGQRMQLAGQVANWGEVDVQAGPGGTARLEVSGSLVSEAGARMNLHNAEVLARGGLVNAGSLNAGGTVSVSGNVDNQAGGLVRVTGAAADVVFLDDFTNDGTVIVSSGSVATFSGRVSGSGAFLDAGRKRFAGGVAPGASPGMLVIGGIVDFVLGDVEMELGGTTPGVEHDKIVFVSGPTITIDPAVDLVVSWWDGFTGSAGDVFDLFDWNIEAPTGSDTLFPVGSGSLTGAFGNVLLPALDPGLAWDITDLYTTGEIRINAVPVPAAAWLFGSGLIGLVVAARRRRT
ncbi:MAG TPA: VPLPA-CTERM sorting domain-containing protein [Thiotrichales bacterium]|nr:VPLPA-CTERM sorting domain-containing protein [Thiotrichales bacterium]